MPEIVNLKYEGALIEEHSGMDAYEVADAIDGFADFLRSIAQANYGETKLQLSISGLRQGSFEIQFLFEVAAAANTALNALGAVSLSDAIKQAVELLKHLRGNSPKSIKQTDRGSVIVENNNGQIIVVNQPIVTAIVNGDASQSAEKFLRRPLNNEADKVQITVDGKKAAEISKSIADSFVPIGNGENLGESVSEPHLTIQALVLEGDGQWRFSDGKNKFRAEISDEAFLSQVKTGRERFGRGDILKVRLRSRQEKIRGQLRTTHVIEKVLEHEPYAGTGQLTLL